MMDFIKIERINRQDIVLLFTLEGINGGGRESKDYILRGFTPIFQPISSQLTHISSKSGHYQRKQEMSKPQSQHGKYLASIWQVSGKYKTEDPLIGMAELGGQSNVQIQSSVV
jgi:hypothetical protein